MKNCEQISTRFMSLDIFRGITVFLMILVNNTWGDYSFEMLEHSTWNGLTPCDVIFPVFIYIMGVSCYLSFNKRGFSRSYADYTHILKRTTILFLAGIIINWAFLSVREGPLCFEHLRIWGPLQRIAVCYFLVSLFAIYCNHKYTIHMVIGWLIIYAIILIYGNGYESVSNENILTKVDIYLFGYEHIYHRSPVDPEGFLGTIPSFAHALIGFYCGKILCSKKPIDDKINDIYFYGAILLVVGYLVSYGLPINKKIWSPSFVLVTCGISSIIFSSLIYLYDLKNKNRNVIFFKAYGINALAIYVISQLLLALFIYLGLCDWLYNIIESIIESQKWVSLLFSMSNLLLYSAIAILMYHFKIIVHI